MNNRNNFTKIQSLLSWFNLSFVIRDRIKIKTHKKSHLNVLGNRDFVKVFKNLARYENNFVELSK